MNKLTGMIVASAVGALFAANVHAEDTAKTAKAEKTAKAAKTMHCKGANSCKGQSDCATQGKNSCKGQNGCDGQGWKDMSKKDCDAATKAKKEKKS